MTAMRCASQIFGLEFQNRLCGMGQEYPRPSCFADAIKLEMQDAHKPIGEKLVIYHVRKAFGRSFSEIRI